jgi:type IV pilus assembly protein PilV
MSLPGVARNGCRGKVRGFSLLEVLVSILLAAMGLLALAGSNVASVRYSKLAQYRGTATMLASDLAERMRANKAAIANYDYSANDFAAQATIAAADTSCESYTQTCTAATLAAYDVNTWRRLVRFQLPEGSVFISVPLGTTVADVWIAWRDPAVADPDDNSTESRNTAADVAKECPNSLNLGTDRSIRCSFFRINL